MFLSVPAAAAVLSIAYGIWWLLLKARYAGGKNGPPVVTTSRRFPYVPLVGVILEFFSSPHQMIKRCYEDYGPIFTIPIFFKRLTFLIGPEAQELFFKASDDVLSQQEVYDFMKPVFGAGIVYDAPKKRRQVQFQTMANGLRASRLKSYVHKIEDETRKYLAEYWGDNEGGGEVDLLKSLSELTILTSSRCLHGEDVRAHLFKEVCELYHDLDHGLTPVTVFWPTAPTAAHKKRDAARRSMVELFATVIRDRRLYPEKSDGTDILSLFMDIKYKDGSAITEEQVTGMLIALLFAGQHTSCITSTWTTHFIANDANMIDRVLQEQEHVLGSKDAGADRPLTFDDLNKFEFLHNCMREALRLCPTFIMILRRAERDAVKVTANKKQFEIPKGDFVCVSPTVSMRLDSTFTDANQFDPDRFAPPREEHKVTPYSYLGFGGGLHSCMGQAFAFVQVKTILSVLFREYHIERVSSEMPAVGYEDMVVGPVGNCRVRYRKRNTTAGTGASAAPPVAVAS